MSRLNHQMRHAKVDLPKPQVHPGHPFRVAKNHDALLTYIKDRLAVGKEHRDSEVPRLTRIDKKMAGWMRMSDEDRARDAKNNDTGEPFVTKLNLPLTFVHVDDMMTYLVQTFAPNRGMFYNTGTPDDVDEASQLVTKMNNDAIYSGYFREVVHGLFSCLKYNLGGFLVQWGSDAGPVVSADGGRRTFDSAVKWQGNRLEALDRYNTLVDPSVHPTKLHMEGEFAATVKLRSHFWVQSRAARGQLHNCDKALEGGGMNTRCEYYRHPPSEAKFTNDESRGSTDWVSILSETPSTLQDGHEVLTIFIRLNPTEFGLVKSNEIVNRRGYELWRFVILDGEWIVSAEHQNNIHNHIPMYFGLVHDDSMGTLQKSPSELLIPLQDFASFLLNTHMEGTRKNIFGTTLFDPTMVRMDKIPKGEVAARLPVEPKAYGKDIRSYVWQMQGNTDTKTTMSDLESVMAIINQFFPTQSLPSQIASIDRAVTDQVAAVQQGANRRQQKTARLLDDTIFRPMRFAMYYNILQYQPDGEDLTDFYSGKQIKLDLAKLKDTNLPFIIGQGLKAIDRTATAQMIQNVIFALIQAPEPAQQVDLLAMIDFWTNMLDVEMDFKQFRRAPPGMGDNGGPPLDDEATRAGTGETPIVPVTDPNAVTEPLRG